MTSYRCFFFGCALVASGCTSQTIAALDAGSRPDSQVVEPDAGPPCDNGVRDGDESHIDCGGSCDACPAGANCVQPSDCESGVCSRGFCLEPSCSDLVRNGLEIGVDCGADCGLCPGGQPCTANDDCVSGRCRASTCEPSSCEDGRMNGDETGTDCGGPECPACGGGSGCRTDDDCDSFICEGGLCEPATCSDRVQNQDETSLDCGGVVCPRCRDGLACLIDPDCIGMRCFAGQCVSCDDDIRNAEETDVDCGGPLCTDCPDGDACVLNGDCVSGRCLDGACISCSDGAQNADETDVDCGGSVCGGCADRRACVIAADCTSGRCDAASSTCISCSDGLVNADETDVDCGGTLCPGCAPGRMCLLDGDCSSSICASSGLCNAPGCGDGVLNGAETDLDCGGGSCLGCMIGQICIVGRDCESGVCTGGTCQAPTCMDGVANGAETDIDCGGSSPCPRCVDGRLCPNGPSDCVSPLCTSGRCGDVRGHVILLGHDYFSRNAGADQVIGNSVMLAPETGTIDVLIYDEFADRTASGEVANLQAAITSELTAAARTVRFTRLSSSGGLVAALTSDIDVFIVAEQESGFSAPYTTIAASWESTLRTFVSSGGVIITTNFLDGGWQLIDRPMLVDIGGVSSGSGTLTVLPAAASHPIAAGVAPYPPPNGTSSYTGVMIGGAISITPIIVDSSARVIVYDALF